MHRVGLLQLESGLSGDMFLGALVGSGADFQAMRRAVGEATGGRADLQSETVMRSGLQATQVSVVIDGKPLQEDISHTEHGHGKTWEGIDAALDAGPLSPDLKHDARAVFRRLGEAEAEVHGVPLHSIHFHELGGLDAVADIVGTLAGVADLSLGNLYHGRINAGGGTVRTAHGKLPVPAPATLELLKGTEIQLQSGAGELLTPTGAALLRFCARPVPAVFCMTPDRVGMGAGSRDLPQQANVARLLIGSPGADADKQTVAVVEASLDDCIPEDLGFLVQLFLDQGAHDATVTPLLMKKGRPGFLLRLLVPADQGQAWADRVVEQTTSTGARWRVESRCCLERRMDTVSIPEGSFRVKVALLPDGSERPHVEFTDLRRAAEETNTPVGDLRRRVERAWEQNR